MSDKKLTLGKKMICGVCGGLAEYLNVDPTIVRVVYAVLTILFAFFLGIIVYFVMYFIMKSA